MIGVAILMLALLAFIGLTVLAAYFVPTDSSTWGRKS